MTATDQSWISIWYKCTNCGEEHPFEIWPEDLVNELPPDTILANCANCDHAETEHKRTASPLINKEK